VFVFIIALLSLGAGEPPPLPADEEIDLSPMIDTNGLVWGDITDSCFDGIFGVSIGEGTTARTGGGDALLEITVTEACLGYPAPPVNDSVVGCAYDLGPDDATFDPPITITLGYDEGLAPPGVNEQDLVIATYDDSAGEWQVMPSIVDPVTNVIVAQADGFSYFAAYSAAPGSPAIQAEDGYSDIPLVEGWNLVALPLVPADGAIEAVLADIMDNVISVCAYDGATATWTNYSPSPAFDSLTNLVDSKGYWFQMSGACTLRVWGTPGLMYE
jgi:hypothetical protein